MIITQSTATLVLPFFMVDSADHITGKTGLTPAVTLSKNGAAFAAPAGAVTAIGNGWYKVAGNATDSNTLGSLVLRATASGADPSDTVFEVAAPLDKTGYSLTAAYDPAKTAASPAQVQAELVTYGAAKPGQAMTLTAAYDDAKNAAQPGEAMTLTSAYDAAKLAAPVGAAMTLTPAYDAAKVAASQASVTTLTGYVDTEVASILAAVDTEVAAIKAVADKLDTALVVDGAVYQFTSNALELGPAGGGGGGTGDAMQSTLLEVKAKTDMLPSDPADASVIADEFNNVHGTLATIAGYVDTEVAAIKAKTDQLTFTGGKVDANADVSVSPSEIEAIADAVLKRDWTALTGEAAYSLLNAARMLRNVWNTTDGTLTVHKEDGTTTAWTRTLSTDPTAEPIIGAS